MWSKHFCFWFFQWQKQCAVQKRLEQFYLPNLTGGKIIFIEKKSVKQHFFIQNYLRTCNCPRHLKLKTILRNMYCWVAKPVKFHKIFQAVSKNYKTVTNVSTYQTPCIIWFCNNFTLPRKKTFHSYLHEGLLFCISSSFYYIFDEQFFRLPNWRSRC